MASPALIASTLLGLALRIDADEPMKMEIGQTIKFAGEMRVVCDLVRKEQVFDLKTVYFDCEEDRACTSDDDCENGRHLGVLTFGSDGRMLVEALLVNPNTRR